MWAGRDEIAETLRREGALRDAKDSAGRTVDELVKEMQDEEERPLTGSDFSTGDLAKYAVNDEGYPSYPLHKDESEWSPSHPTRHLPAN